MLEEDIGYSDSLTWTLQSDRKRTSIVSFQGEFSLIGFPLYRLVAAGKRLYLNSPYASVRKAIDAIRRLARAIHAYCPKESTSLEVYAESLVRFLSEDHCAEKTRWSYCQYAFAILTELAREQNQHFRRRNPFSRTRRSPRSDAEKATVDNVISAAKADALAILERFEHPPAEHIAFISEAKTLAADRGGILSTKTAADVAVFALVKRWKRATGLSMKDLQRYLYPTLYDLAPFFILLTWHLAANPDSLTYLRCDALTTYEHVVHGAMAKIELEKPRSNGKLPPYKVRDQGTLKPAWLIRTLMKLSHFIRPYAADEVRNFVFIYGGREIGVLSGGLRTFAIKKYIASRSLPSLTLAQLRPYRLSVHHNSGADPRETQELAGHGSIVQTMEYLDDLASEEFDATVIANSQLTLGKRAASARTRKNTSKGQTTAVSPALECNDPTSTAHGVDAHGFCACLLWPFNDRHFVLSPEPRAIALLLRDYEALCDAQLCIPAIRFAKAMYATKKQMIEQMIAEMDHALLTAAKDIAATLPKAPRID